MKLSNRILLSIALIAPLSIANPVIAQGLLWVKSYGGPDLDASYNVVLDDAGNVYVSGSFSGAVVFGAGEANETVLTSTAGSPYDMFLAKHNRKGELAWVKQAS